MEQRAEELHKSSKKSARWVERYRPYIPIVGGFLGIALAAAGELLVESKDRTILSLLLYLAGIAIFTISAWFMQPFVKESATISAAPESLGQVKQIRTWVILGGGIAFAVVLNIVALLMIREQLDSAPGLYLWLASLLVIGATGVIAGGALNWPPRWIGGIMPANRNGRLLLLALVVIILVVASASRLIALDKIPFGINADEGDRASTSIQIVRDFNTASIFDSGWYHISNLYFWLLAQLMKVIGIGFAQARVFGALASIISVAVVTWVGIRHFSIRTGLIAGGILSLLAISLQFARETSEAGPTATLWAISFALMLEGTRTGKAWAWIGAGLAGGSSLYFYPSGRLWALVAVGFVLYLLVHGLGGRRLDILRSAALAGVAALMVAGPFFIHTMPIFAPPGRPGLDLFTVRAQETSIFSGDNPTRLSYYQRDWNTVQLLAAQVDHSIGMFNQYHDDGGFWPTDKPITSGLLTVLTLLGVGWVSTRWRDPRYTLLALWFWVGLAGVIVTVETPNVQRFATAVPALALFPALVLDNLALRIEAFLAKRKRASQGARVMWATSGGVAAVTIFLAATQYNFYFNEYGQTDRWPQPTIQGQAVADQGVNTLVVSIGPQFHMVNSGWVRLLAPDTPRGGVRNPGMDLPLNIAADKNLTFINYPRLAEYIPYLKDIYPGGRLIPYTHPTEGLVLTAYRLSEEQWAATQGAMAQVNGGSQVRVGALGEIPPGVTTFPATIRWTAGLRVSRYWNYGFRVATGIARLIIDGAPVLNALEDQPRQAAVSLARGLHYVEYEATVRDATQATQVEWTRKPENAPEDNPDPDGWTTPKAEELYAIMKGPQGLFGIVYIQDGEKARAEQRRIDGALAFCCLTDQLDSRGKPYIAQWIGAVRAPAPGVYSMTLQAQGAVEMRIDYDTVIKSDGPSDALLEGSVNLTAGSHPVQIDFRVDGGGGGLEWTWIPPGGERSIVPPSALAPPERSGIRDKLPVEVLGDLSDQPESVSPLETIP